MHKARVRRPRRSTRPLPDPTTPRATRYDAEAPELLRGYVDAPVSRRNLKIAGVSALAFHFLLFFIVIPTAQVAPIRIDERATATVLTRYEPPAPPSRPERRRSKTKNLIPVPDATPRDPEPIVDDQTTLEVGDAEAEFSVGLPDAPPGPRGARTGAFPIGTGALSSPLLLHKVVPDYTPAATRAGIQGRVYIEAVITEAGAVVEPVLIRGLADEELNRRALEAVVKWKFKPGSKDGAPVKVVATFTIDFNIH